MNMDRAPILSRIPVVTLLLFAFIGEGFGYCQDKSSVPRKFKELENLPSDDMMAYLDLFAQELGKDSSLRAVIVGYREEGWLPGSFLRYVHGFGDYLVNSRGVDPERVKVIDVPTRARMKTELWLVPPGASLPVVSQEVGYSVESLLEFDQLQIGAGCVGEFTLELQEPSDALKFFAEALQKNPTAKGIVVVHPARSGSLRTSKELAGAARGSLVNNYHIAANRVFSSIDSRRACAGLDLWLVPPSLTLPKSGSLGFFFQSQLMSEAEKNDYTVRRVELLGNTYTRDNVIRRRLLQNEGDIFRRKLLEHSLRNVSKLKNFKPVGLQDVEVHLNKEERTIDFLINLTERTGSRKRQTQ